MRVWIEIHFGESLLFSLLSEEVERTRAGMHAASRDSCAWMTDCSRERHRQLARWAVICVCVCVREINEISHQAESFSSSLQKRLKVRRAVSADAFYSLAGHQAARRGVSAAHQLIPSPIHPLAHTLPSIYYHPGPPWQEEVHLPGKLGGEMRGDGPCWSSYIPLLMYRGEMDWLRCPDFPCDDSNCVVM